MGSRFRIQLSDKEILIIAALLGYESVLGVDDSTIFKEGADIKAMIRHQVQRLERKKIIRYNLNGILEVIPELKQMINCICCAEIAGIFSTNLRADKKHSVYVMKKEDIVVTLERLKTGKYSMQLVDAIPLKKIIPGEILSSQIITIKEKILLDEAKYVHKQIGTFNYYGAEEHIQKHVKNKDSVKIISRILSGNNGYMSVQIYERTNKIYNSIYNTVLVLADTCIVTLDVDENHMLCFESVPATYIVEEVERRFEFVKREVQV